MQFSKALGLLASPFSKNRLSGRRRRVNAPASVESLETRVLLSAISVSNTQEFIDAIDQANADPSVKMIKFAKDATAVRLEGTVTFTGGQDLTIDGNGGVIRAKNGSEGDFDLFVTTGGGDLTLRELTFRNGLDGVLVEVPTDATGVVKVKLRDVRIFGSGEFGLHVDDLGGSDASIKLELNGSTFRGNGVGALDFDGIRVDERGEGSIYAYINDTVINANGGDGLELDEGDAGDVYLTMKDSSLNRNGFFNEEDLDDGLDIDEAGDGSVYVRLHNVQANNNLDEGIDLDEEDDGGVFVNFKDVTANGNFDEGIKISEEDAGGIGARLKNVVANRNGDDGIEFEEADGGGIFAWFDYVSTNRNGDEGIQLEEAGDGSVFARLKDVTANRNAGHGLQATEGDGGSLLMSIKDSVFSRNDGFGISVEQEGPGFGLLLLDDVALNGNGDGDIESNGVFVFGS